MGCCNSARPKTDLGSFKSVNLPDICISVENSKNSPEKSITFLICEIKLTKTIEKIVNFPCSMLLHLSYDDNLYSLDLGDVWNYVQEYRPGRFIRLPHKENVEEMTVSTMCLVESKEVEIASTLLDLCIIENFFKGIVMLTYRSLKVAFLSVEIFFGCDPNEELTLSFASPRSEKAKSMYYPCKRYPEDIKRYFTPNFSDEKLVSQQEIDPYIQIDIIKNPKTSFNELVEFLGSTVPEVIYYTLGRLIYYASQSSYALQLITKEGQRIKEIIKEFSRDKLIEEKSLELVFEVIRCLEGNSLELTIFLDIDFVNSLTLLAHNNKIASLIVEIILKYLYFGKNKSASLVRTTQLSLIKPVLDFCKKMIKAYDSGEIRSAFLAIIFVMIQLASTPETVSSNQVAGIFTFEIFEFIINCQIHFLYNLEIVQMTLKIMKLFLTHKKFKQVMVEANCFQQLIPIASYFTDADIQKLLMSIIKEVLCLTLTDQVSIEIHNLILEILKNSSDNISIAESAIGIFKVIAQDISKQLVSEESIEAYCVMFICMKGEIEFEMSLLSLFKQIKDGDEASIKVLRNNKRIEDFLNELIESYSISSTGSGGSRETAYLKLRVMVEEILGTRA